MARRRATFAGASVLLTVLSAQAYAQPEPTAPEPSPAAAPPAPAPPAPAVVAPAAAPVVEAPAPATAGPPTGFTFGSYGRIIAATDARGRPGRDADVVAHGSRLDEANYAELELRRDDHWQKTDATTRLVATIAVGNPVFHYAGDFDAKLAIRNLYLEAQGLGSPALAVWVGSRMYRGDDIYLLDWWPLDNLNTVGAGARYAFGERTTAAVHMGLNQPSSAFFYQEASRVPALNQFGAASVAVLDRQRFIGSLKLTHTIPVGGGAGLTGVGYAEMHRLPEGQRETDPAVFETLPADGGYVIGAQIGAFSGDRDTHVNLFLRYARGLAAYGELATPGQLGLDGTTGGAHELVTAVSGNWELGPVGVMLAAYVRSFRDASEGLNFEDVDEGLVAARPHLFFGETGGLAAEASYQAVQHGVVSVTPDEAAEGLSPHGPLTAHLVRFGLIPFLSPAGRGDFSRPQFRLIYTVTLRDDAARSLYPKDDVFGLRSTEHFLGFGAEWWFNSSSYGG